MTPSFRLLSRRLWVAVLLSLALWGPATVTALPTTVRHLAIDALASYATGNRALDHALANIGFEPPASPQRDVLSRMSDIRKIELGYWSAEEARPNRGGREFMALLHRQLALDFPAVLQEPRLSFLKKVSAKPPQRFAPRSSSVPLQRPPSPYWEAIRAASLYGTGTHGSQAELLIKTFQLSEEDAYDILRRSDQFSDAIAEGYRRAGDVAGKKALRKMAIDLARENPAVQQDKEVASLFDKNRFPTDLVMPPDLLSGDILAKPDVGGARNPFAEDLLHPSVRPIPETTFHVPATHPPFEPYHPVFRPMRPFRP